MPIVYILKTAGASPISLDDAKTYMKIPASITTDDAVIQSMINAATEWGQKYTGREFTNNVWQALMSCFPTRIMLKRDPVDTIDTITYLVSGTLTTVSASVYYLVKNTQSSDVVLEEGMSWPTDGDSKENTYIVGFTTKIYYCDKEIIEALKRHVAYWYLNRGDCPGSKDAAESSGVDLIYNQFRITRV